MITYKDIRIAVNRQLKKTGIEVNSRDVEEGFNRPSFFVQLDNLNRSGDKEQVHKSMAVRIYYFPTDRYEYAIEVLDMQETIERLFDLKIAVKDRYFNVDEILTNLTDGVLNCSFDIQFYDGRVYDGLENDWVEVEFPRPTPDGPDAGYNKPHPVEKMHDLDIENKKE